MSFSKEFRHTNLAPRPQTLVPVLFAEKRYREPESASYVARGFHAQFLAPSPPSAPQWAPIDTKEST